MKLYERYIKRPMDIVLSSAALIVLSPALILLASLVRIKLGAPVLFRQARLGKDETIFLLLKFRTMTDARDEQGNLLPDEERLTPFGKFLRSTSLDELPELFNILKGDMSVIGPRPLLIQYLPRYDAVQRRRHEVRPGLSGLAQIGGRNELCWEKRLQKDVEYVDHIIFLGDWKIILTTLIKAVKREGINSETSATMEEFKGTHQE